MQSPRLDFTAQGALSLFAIAALVGYGVLSMRPLPENSMELHATGSQIRADLEAPQRAAVSTPIAAENKATATTLSGTIVKDRTSFVLRDSAGMVYQLDDASKAEPFAGMPVTITGTLEASTKMIHVRQIQGLNV